METLQKLAKRWTYQIARQMARVVGSAYFQIRCTGRENFPSAGGVLVCANHQSYFDPVIVGLCCDRRIACLARRTLFRAPLFRALIDWFDAIPIEREGLGIGGLKETIRRLKNAESVLMFPEGTRTLNGELGQIKPGLAALVRRVAVPIIPVSIDGAYQAWPKKQRIPRRESIHVVIGKPITADEIRNASDDELSQLVARRLQDGLDRARDGRRHLM